MESTNRMRINPQGELPVLFSNVNTLQAQDPATQSAINFFGVDADVLLSQWSQLTPVAPVAWNEDLIDSAFKHNNQMIAFDMQEHTLPGESEIGDRIRAEGYPLNRATENIYAFAENHIHGHAGFVIDWGEGPGGIQDPAGHRDNYMDAGVEEVGISVVAESNPATDVGPFLITQDFGRRANYQPQVLGVVYNDINSNGIYDPGEGLSNVNITVRGSRGTTGSFTTQTMTAGGYQIPVPDGNYEVNASGPGLSGTFVVGNVVMDGANTKADFEAQSSLQAPVANADTIPLNEDSTSTFLVTPNDVAFGGSIVRNSVTIVRHPARGSASVDASGRITYIPDPNFSGSDSLDYTVRDTNGATSNIARVNLNVGNVSDPPILSPSFSTTRVVAEDTQLTIDLADFVTDSDGDLDWNTLTLTASPSNGQASADGAGRRILYTPNSGFSGQDSLTFRVSDGTGQSIPPTIVNINVTPVNDRPVAVDDIFTAVDRSTATLSVRTNDSDPDSSIGNATLHILTQPTTGTVSVSGSNLIYTGPADFIGAVTIRYRLQDLDGEFSEPATVTLYSVSTDGNPYQNPGNRFDVSGDGQVAPLDALMVINALGTTLTPPTPGVTRGASPFVDVIGNGQVIPLGALQVINVLNNGVNQAAGSRAALSANITDDLFADEEDEEIKSQPNHTWWNFAAE